MQEFYRSEKCFRRYEPVISAACAAYPNAICFAPPDTRRTIATDKARIRDAITAWCDQKWPTSPDVTPSKMRDLTVWVEDRDELTYIYVGPIRIQRVRKATIRLANRMRIPCDTEILPIQEVDMMPAKAPTPPPPPPLSLEERIDALNSGRSSERYVYAHTPELFSEITTLIADKLNVQLVVRDGKIILF